MKADSSVLLPLMLASLFLTAGCAVGPDYQRPELPGQIGMSPPAAPPAGSASSWWQSTVDPVLKSLVERALTDNRDLRGALARLEESRALRRESQTGFLPVGTVSAGYRRQLDSTVFYKGVSRDFRDQDIFDVGVDTAWELDLFGRVRRSNEASNALAAASAADFEQMRLLIAAETGRAYVEYRATHELLALRQRQLSTAQKSLAILRLQVTEGKTDREQLAAAETELATWQGAVRDLRLAGRAAGNRLGVLTGIGHAPELASGVLPRLSTPIITSNPIALLAHRPDVQASERRLAASTAAIGVARADYFPTLRLMGRVGAEATKADDITTADANFFSFGPRLTWDLLNLHRVHARVKGAEARSRQALAAWEQAILLALEEIDNALARRDEAVAKHGEWQRASAASDIAWRIARTKAAEGLLDPRQTLAAESAALNARAECIRTEAELAISTIYLQLSLAAP
jgi:NodT family efflux transporter outer membrane factor (OMF) lipoprotein